MEKRTVVVMVTIQLPAQCIGCVIPLAGSNPGYLLRIPDWPGDSTEPGDLVDQPASWLKREWRQTWSSPKSRRRP